MNIVIKYSALVPMMIASGCVSLPNNMPALPNVQGFAILPNCVAWCHIMVTVEKADSKIDSSGGGAVTGGAQSLSSTSTQTTSSTDTKTADPKP